MRHNPFRGMRPAEWFLLFLSVTVLTAAHFLGGSGDLLTWIASLTGAVFLVLLSRGDVWGQLLTVVFSLLYGVIAWRSHYWGELVTYLGMTAPMAFSAMLRWLRHPFQGNQSEVEIAHPDRRQWIRMLLWTVAVTALTGVLLTLLDTPNLPWSILSVATSFLAVYLTNLRSSWYALAYAANDLVLIILWLLMSRTDPAAGTMAVNFSIFLINDSYGFVCWRRREIRQLAEARRSAAPIQNISA